MEAPFRPPVSAGLFWCLVFEVARFERSPIQYALETDWPAGGILNLCISKSDLLNFIPPQRV